MRITNSIVCSGLVASKPSTTCADEKSNVDFECRTFLNIEVFPRVCLVPIQLQQPCVSFLPVAPLSLLSLHGYFSVDTASAPQIGNDSQPFASALACPGPLSQISARCEWKETLVLAPVEFGCQPLRGRKPCRISEACWNPAALPGTAGNRRDQTLRRIWTL